MDCVFSKCTVRNNNEKSVFCWICNDTAHLKCAGFSGKSFEKLSVPSNGFRWFCWKCRETESDFNILYLNSKKSFAELKHCFDLVKERMLQFEGMFNALKFNREHINSLPMQKEPSTPSNLLDMQNSAEAPALFLPPVPAVDIDRARNVENFNNAIDALTLDTDIRDERIAVTDSNVLVIDSSDEPIAISPNSSNNLVVVPPRKTIFISRLSHDTPVGSLVDYIKQHCKDYNDKDCKVFKINYYQPRDISSFKIVVPEKLFHTIVTETFWPAGVLVKEFIPRDRQGRTSRINLPTSASKN